MNTNRALGSVKGWQGVVLLAVVGAAALACGDGGDGALAGDPAPPGGPALPGAPAPAGEGGGSSGVSVGGSFVGPSGSFGEVSHFRTGFFGDVDDAGDDAGPDDAGSEGAADGGEADASADADAGACIAAPVVDPRSLGEAGPGQSFPAGSFGCPLGASLGQVPRARVMTFTAPVRFTMWEAHAAGIQSNASRAHVRAGCDGASPVLVANGGYNCRTSSSVLDPGTYTFVSCDALGQFYADPIPTATNTNVSCATAATLLTGQARVYDGTKLYFKAPAGTIPRTVSVSSADGMTAGAYRMTVQTTCDDPSTNVLVVAPGGTMSGTVCIAGSDDHGLPAAPAGSTYWFVLDAIDPGLRLKLAFK